MSAQGEAPDHVIDGMCMTWRHDFGLVIPAKLVGGDYIGSGMTEAERESLRRSMRQLWEHNIAPYIASLSAPSPAATVAEGVAAWEAKPNEADWGTGLSSFHRSRHDDDFLRGLDMEQRPLYPAPSGPADARVRAAEQAVIKAVMSSFDDPLGRKYMMPSIEDACAALAALRSGGSA